MFERPFEELIAGTRFTTRGRTVTEADVVGFAGLTGDRHPVHTDARWAAASPFGERIAHGLLVLSIGAGLVPLDPSRVVALRRVRDAVFKRPVHLGETIAVEGRIIDLRAVDAGTGLVGVALTITDEEERTVARATVDLLWRRDDPEPAGLQPVEPSGYVHALTSVPL